MAWGPNHGQLSTRRSRGYFCPFSRPFVSLKNKHRDATQAKKTRRNSPNTRPRDYPSHPWTKLGLYRTPLRKLWAYYMVYTNKDEIAQICPNSLKSTFFCLNTPIYIYFQQQVYIGAFSMPYVCLISLELNKVFTACWRHFFGKKKQKQIETILERNL